MGLFCFPYQAAPTPSTGSFDAGQERLQSNFTQSEYQTAVQQVIDYIAAGDVYQVNLSQRFKVPFKGGDGFALFRQLFAQNSALFFAFIQGGDHQIVSTSPERFLLQSGDRVETRPIKGSRPPWYHNLLVLARPYVHRLKVISGDGLYLGTYPYPRQTPLADYKTLNYLYYQQAGQWDHTMGFHEALVLNPDGTISETHTANLLLIDGREVIRPKSSAVLPGVMAAAVCRQLAAWDYCIV